MSDSNPSRRGFLGTMAALPLAGAANIEASAPPIGVSGAMYRLGAIGNGKRGREELRAIKDGGFPCQVVALCDVVGEHAEQAKEICGGNPVIYDDYRKLLAHQGLDIVLISTPPFLHKEMVCAALAGNVHVVCEKPMGLTVEECDAMIAAWRGGNSVFMLAMQNRFHKCHVKVHELIAAGAIGEVKHIAGTEFRGDWSPNEAGPINSTKYNWRYYDALSGGIMLEKTVHDFDLFDLWTASYPVRICGVAGPPFFPGRESPDHASVVAEYASGCTVSMDVNVGCRRGKGFHQFVIAGTKGQMVFERKGKRIALTVWEPQFKEQAIDIALDPRDIRHGGTVEMWDDFFACLKDRKLPSANPMVARLAVKGGQAAQMAITTRRIVETRDLGL